eukprot:CAMPEP_0173059610 /NCGR_PEP_ID=MMETSP1102-20130122/2097_1 /TAXON_ID=49646 /ORGANISM="Geminigera sp., Strain Caron Lab Isolate" /LENGTH=236 /DNA_ID=CAMNT_0013925667 /DNA_START=43 /DNA_END=750 /DNA_ORIENTATION=+
MENSAEHKETNENGNEGTPDTNCLSRFMKTVFGLEKGSKHHQGSKLVHPDSGFATFLQLVSMVLLTYTALYTPVTVGFHWNVPPCYRAPTLEFDVFLDAFFLFEIIVNFFIGIEQNGMYIDEHKQVILTYIQGSFVFDLLTSIPGSIVDLVTLQTCFVPGPGEDSGEGGAAQNLKLVRLLKPLRLLKMKKVLKMLNLGGVMRYLESSLGCPHEIFRMILTALSTFGVVHVCACFFW